MTIMTCGTRFVFITVNERINTAPNIIHDFKNDSNEKGRAETRPFFAKLFVPTPFFSQANFPEGVTKFGEANY